MDEIIYFGGSTTCSYASEESRLISLHKLFINSSGHRQANKWGERLSITILLWERALS